jgi:hypothetical protein
MNPEQVTACLVTRGDQPEMMGKIRESLIFKNVVVWDNNVDGDFKCAGRYKAAEIASHDIVYFQDDDVIVPQATQKALLEQYEPVVMVANWGHGENPDGYDDLPLVCGGAIVDRELCFQAWDRYEQAWPADEEFMYEADFALGVLYPAFRHIYEVFEIDLSIAQHPSRLCNQPWQKELKLKITEQARQVRDMVTA